MPKLLFIVSLFFFSSLFIIPFHVSAAISACNVSINPSTINKSSDTTVTFSVTNNDSRGNSAQWIRIAVPSNKFSIRQSNNSDWSLSGTDDGTGGYSDIQLTTPGNGIPVSSSTDFPLVIHASDQLTSNESWSVQMTDNNNGSNNVDCSGGLGVSIGTPPSPAPNLSDVTIANITSSTVTLSWTTDVNGDGKVNYGTSSSYGSESNDSNQSTSHSISLNGLSPNTTYHFQISSANSQGTRSTSGDNTFTTAIAGQTLPNQTATTTSNSSVTKIIIVTPTPTPPDTTPPYPVIDTDLSKFFSVNPSIKGHATDDRGVESIEYSLDNGADWQPVDSTTGTGSKYATFVFTPQITDDDNYAIKVRAKDTSSNVGISKAYTLVIDRLPPRIGGGLVSIGPEPLLPGSDGNIIAVSGVSEKLTVASVGGPINVLVTSGTDQFALRKNTDNGLWLGSIRFDKPGKYPLKVQAIDGAGNKTERVLGSVLVIDAGKILSKEGKPIKNASIQVYYQEPTSKRFVLWDGSAYGQANPQRTNEKGEYSLFLPEGLYYAKVSAHTFIQQTSDLFQIRKPTPVTTLFHLREEKALNLGLFTLHWPDFSVDSIQITFFNQQQASLLQHENEEAPLFSLSTTDGGMVNAVDLRGSSSIISFVSTWSPLAVQQIKELDSLKKESGTHIALVDSEESLAKVDIFRRRGRYTIPFVVDSDGILLNDYPLFSLPTNYLLDRKGIIRKVISHVMTKDEIQQQLLQIDGQ